MSTSDGGKICPICGKEYPSWQSHCQNLIAHPQGPEDGPRGIGERSRGQTKDIPLDAEAWRRCHYGYDD